MPAQPSMSSLLPPWAFVVQFRVETDLVQGRCTGAGGTCGVRPSRALSVVGGVAGFSHAGVDSRARPEPLPALRQGKPTTRPGAGSGKEVRSRERQHRERQRSAEAARDAPLF